MKLLEHRLNLPERFEVPRLERVNGNTLLICNLLGWGANLHFLTNGGGAVHLNEYIYPLKTLNDLTTGVPLSFVVHETLASYAAPAHYLAGNRLAVCNLTTGGAPDLANSAATEVRMHNTPAIYLAALSASTAGNNAPLQDTTSNGFNTVATMMARHGDGCQVVDSVNSLEGVLYNARNRLMDSKPVVILYHPDILKQEVSWFQVPWEERPRQMDEDALQEFLVHFTNQTNSKRVVLFVGEEAARYERMPDLTTALAKLLKAPTLYTQIGVSGVSSDNEFAAGYLMLGHNDFSRKLWQSLSSEDTLICIGFDPFEYSTNQEKIKANTVVITNYNNPYGSVNGTFEHRVEEGRRYMHINGDLELVVKGMIDNLRTQQLIRPHVEIPKNLNDVSYKAPPKQFTNMVRFYESFASLLEPGTIYIGDVCTGYKDFQRVTQRPIPGVKVLYFHQGSLMGQGGGEALGVRFARPDAHVHLVTGDGCFRYFGATLGEMKNLGLVVWLLDNRTHALVSWGLSKIKPYMKAERKLTDVTPIDYVRMAKAQRWDGFNLRPDLDNIEKIMNRANEPGNTKSMLVRVKMHPDDDLGQNPRLDTLGRQGQANL